MVIKSQYKITSFQKNRQKLCTEILDDDDYKLCVNQDFHQVFVKTESGVAENCVCSVCKQKMSNDHFYFCQPLTFINILFIYSIIQFFAAANTKISYTWEMKKVRELG